MPKQVKAFECPICGELHRDEDFAKDCCPCDERDVFECALCEQLHLHRQGAINCCSVEYHTNCIKQLSEAQAQSPGHKSYCEHLMSSHAKKIKTIEERVANAKK